MTAHEFAPRYFGIGCRWKVMMLLLTAKRSKERSPGSRYSAHPGCKGEMISEHPEWVRQLFDPCRVVGVYATPGPQGALADSRPWAAME
jgi:hypothetical protein